jgi:Leucine-rich repeat (LRR) protein
MTRDELLALIDQVAAAGWTELDLAGQGLTELPPEIGKLTQLKSLVLGKFAKEKSEWIGNQLTALPEAIVQLQSLQQLHLGANQISAIPESLAQLQSLQELDLGHNKISVIPES